MALSKNEQPITSQLSQAIKDMRDFCVDQQPSVSNPADREQYENLFHRVEILATKANTEGYFDYEHTNLHKTLTDFLAENNISDLVKKYYSIPIFWKRKLFGARTESKIRNGNIIAGGSIVAGGNIIVGTNQINTTAKNEREWYERPFGKIVIGVFISTIVAGIVFSLGWN